MNKYGLLGHPLLHSCSPTIHNELFAMNNISAVYEIYDILEEEIPSYLEKLRKKELNGLNVTIPYKEKVIPYLDELSEAAQIIGACNTIYLKNGKLIGDNTDYFGFIKQLERQKIDVKNKNVYVLGSGGASKAILYALRLLGALPTVVSRNGPFSYQDLTLVDKIDVLINTTPIGMFPNVKVSPVGIDIIQKTNICIEVIFNPRKTLFLKMANQSNDGLPMLVYQAIKAEELWQNKKIVFDYELILKACERKLENYE